MKYFIITLFFFIGLGPISAQNNQIETVVAFGTGVNQVDALYNAKLNAMDQIFGTFISTKTVISNDSIVMNNVISITNGQITNYEILKTDKTENGYIITIKVTTNLQNLVAFCKSIGVDSYIQGSMFSDILATKLKNKENEIKVLNSFLETFKKEIPTLFDYSIITSDLPIFLQSNEQTCYKYLRSKESQKIILNFVKLIEEYVQTHAIVRNDRKELRPYSRIGDNFNFLYFLNGESWESYKFFSTYNQLLSIGKLSYKCDKGDEQYLADAIKKKYNISTCIDISDSTLYSEKFEYGNKINIETPFFIITSKCVSYSNSKVKFTYNDWVTVDEMKKIEKYTIKKL